MRVLAVKLSSLGDILHVLPAVQALKEQTGAELDWVVHPEFAPLVRCFACVSEVLTFPRRHLRRDLGAALRALRARKYDLVVDFHGLMKSALVTALARGARKVGPSYSRELSWLLYPERAGKMHRDCHAAEQAFDTLDYLGLHRPERPLSAEDFILPAPPAIAPGRPLVAFAPVSRWESKNWPAENFARLAERAAAEWPDATFAVVGGRGDFAVGETIAAAPGTAGRVANLCGKTSVAESMALLAKCDLLVANDTGPVHMAAAVGTPCLVLFGPTRPDWTGPFGEGHRILSKDLPCRPCLRRRCPRGTGECLASITPEEVLEAMRQMEKEKTPCRQ